MTKRVSRATTEVDDEKGSGFRLEATGMHVDTNIRKVRTPFCPRLSTICISHRFYCGKPYPSRTLESSLQGYLDSKQVDNLRTNHRASHCSLLSPSRLSFWSGACMCCKAIHLLIKPAIYYDASRNCKGNFVEAGVN